MPFFLTYCLFLILFWYMLSSYIVFIVFSLCSPHACFAFPVCVESGTAFIFVLYYLWLSQLIPLSSELYTCLECMHTSFVWSQVFSVIVALLPGFLSLFVTSGWIGCDRLRAEKSYQSTNHSINEWSNQPFNRSTNQSINQSNTKWLNKWINKFNQ